MNETDRSGVGSLEQLQFLAFSDPKFIGSYKCNQKDLGRHPPNVQVSSAGPSKTEATSIPHHLSLEPWPGFGGLGGQLVRHLALGLDR